MINDLLPLYIDGVCSEESKKLVEEHMKTCDSCRKTAEQMKSDLALPMKDSADVKGFRKFVNKKVWGRALIIIVIFAVLWVVGNWGYFTLVGGMAGDRCRGYSGKCGSGRDGWSVISASVCSLRKRTDRDDQYRRGTGKWNCKILSR